MTATENDTSQRQDWLREAAAAARAAIDMRQRAGREVPSWLRDAAAGRPTAGPDRIGS
ncbi:hypothetical protein [Rhodococcoides kyotonense]|uniref:PH domain-containing protein n=1 Tax=Rhodococcoides kyotonense TaxID=398843 RepID=A0A239I0K0_9NOCA|nr:hypothetical protein [Rhodococcus kyotonensis]SNS86563.1 hypothetical protein SAMN05421642_106120 [Rhodococcus kyotonensis]